MPEQEQKTTAVSQYMDLQRIKNEVDRDKEIANQEREQRAKL